MRRGARASLPSARPTSRTVWLGPAVTFEGKVALQETRPACVLGWWTMRGIIGLNAYVTMIRTRVCSTSYKNICLSCFFTVSQGTIISYMNGLCAATRD